MTRHEFRAAALAGAVGIALATGAGAASFTLDFETSATGADLLSGALASPLGTISLFQGTPGTAFIGTTAFGGFPSDLPLSIFGARLVEAGSTDVIGLDFGFDVASVSFNFGGDGGGFAASVLDAGGAVLDSIAITDLPASGLAPGPATLTSTGPAIRFFRFDDPFAGAGVDNILISAASVVVPLPATLPLLGGAILGALAVGRRTRQA